MSKDVTRHNIGDEKIRKADGFVLNFPLKTKSNRNFSRDILLNVVKGKKTVNLG